MHKELLAAAEKLIIYAQSQQLSLVDERAIPYGTQLYFVSKAVSTPMIVSVYYSDKKGLSYVLGGKKDHPLRSLFEGYLNPKQTTLDLLLNQHSWKTWIGTDEAGKGDFFGPLVTAAFCMTPEIQLELTQHPIKDSKLLNDAMITKVAKMLLAKYKANIRILILHPAKYNDLYEKFRASNKKLNELLVWTHTTLIAELMSAFPVDGVLVDQFVKPESFFRNLKIADKHKIVLQTKAESDLAVACASIIARYYFITSIDNMSKEYGFTFPKGCSTPVKKAGKEFVLKLGQEKLSDVAKIHFKTYNEIL